MHLCWIFGSKCDGSTLGLPTRLIIVEKFPFFKAVVDQRIIFQTYLLAHFFGKTKHATFCVVESGKTKHFFSAHGAGAWKWKEALASKLRKAGPRSPTIESICICGQLRPITLFTLLRQKPVLLLSKPSDTQNIYGTYNCRAERGNVFGRIYPGRQNGHGRNLIYCHWICMVVKNSALESISLRAIMVANSV